MINNSIIRSKYPDGITEDELNENVIAFNVYYKDLKYTKITQTEKTSFVDLLSILGGILGKYF